jgi:ketosteroid isomerase-like protein
MSQENVEIVRASIAAYNRGDWDAALKDFDPYFVFRPVANWPENRPTLGRDAYRSFFDELTTTLGTGAATVIEDPIDAGLQVLTRTRVRSHGRSSGIEDELTFTQVHTFRRRKVVMLEYFIDHQEALEAAGLRE